MATLKQRVANLLTVKSAVTLILTGAFVFLTVNGEVKAESFLSVYTVIIGFYFGTQFDKKERDKDV